MQNLKCIFLLLVLTICAPIANSQELNYQITDKNGNEKLLGIINREGLMQSPFQKWFQNGFNGYEVDITAIEATKKELSNFTVKIFMGTWCGDSKREVPRFYKVLKAANFPEDQILAVAVDYIQPNYKKSPGGEEKGMNILKVPTFIFYKNGREINRIIEFPVASFEEDIAAIVTGKDYVPNYNNLPALPVD